MIGNYIIPTCLDLSVHQSLISKIGVNSAMEIVLTVLNNGPTQAVDATLLYNLPLGFVYDHSACVATA